MNAPDSAPAKLRGSGAAPTRVLIVDDDRDVLSSLEKGLSRAGYEVRVAASGGEALAALGDGRETFDIAVIDLMLPDTWGPQMAVAHSQFQPGLKVIYISGHGGDDAVLTATSTHSRDVAFLPKPFAIQELVQLIQEKLAPPAAG